MESDGGAMERWPLSRLSQSYKPDLVRLTGTTRLDPTRPPAQPDPTDNRPD
ncbi:hypothetical protein CDL15_Pgr026714 [Punica granatum]|uniref:Uncharacterized protein n=1 Tax=Punica granatum TaxID=22663 RepID=A0A218WLE3_PUNGR|nr:hypothetical protein CDL15_Pgr026714 [Punica granatum]